MPRGTPFACWPSVRVFSLCVVKGGEALGGNEGRNDFAWEIFFPW